jgi:hypothetical protein
LCRNPSCHTLSNAFSKSRNTTAVFSSLLVVLARWSITFVSWLVVECCGLNANWSARIAVDMTFLRWINIMISRTLAIELMKAIGRCLLGFLRSLPVLGIIITVAVFQGVKKFLYIKQQLRILVTLRMVFSEKCRSAVFDMPSGPGALFQGRCLMMFFTSLGETGWIGGFSIEFKNCIELVTNESVAGVQIRQLNCEARLVAKNSDFHGELKTVPNCPFSEWFGGILLIIDLLILNTFVSLGFRFAKK